MIDSDDAAALALLGELGDSARVERAAQARTVAACHSLFELRVPVGDGEVMAAGAEFVAEEISVALSVSVFTANQFLEVGHQLAGRLPNMRSAFETGRVSFAQVRTITDRLQHIADPVVLFGLERRILSQVLSSDQVLTPRRLAALVDRAVAEADPELVKERRVRAHSDRQIRIRADADGMSGIWGILPAADGLLADAALTAAADSVCHDDPRTFTQRRVDAFTALTQGEILYCRCGNPACVNLPDDPPAEDDTLAGDESEWDEPESNGAAPDGAVPDDTEPDDTEPDDTEPDDTVPDDTVPDDTVPDGAEPDDTVPDDTVATSSPAADGSTSPTPVAPGSRGRRRSATPGAGEPVIQVLIDLSTLLGASDLPGVLRGYGIVDSDLVRTLAADARWQALLTVDGIPVHTGRRGPPGTPTRRAARTYRPSRALAAAVRARDQHCRFAGCTVPAGACDLDHVVPFDHQHPERGGLTALANLACLCRRHHRMKTAGVWAVVMDPDGTQRWTGPAGGGHTSRPTGLPSRAGVPAAPGTRPVLSPEPGPRWEPEAPEHPEEHDRPALFDTHGAWFGYPDDLAAQDAWDASPEGIAAFLDSPAARRISAETDAHRLQEEQRAALAYASGPDAPPPF